MCTCECQKSKVCIEERRGFEPVVRNLLKSYKQPDEVIMPQRGTKSSAGYDFFTPIEIELLQGESFVIWTDVKAYMMDNEVLKIYPRSSLGIKRGISIKNTVGIIDADYYSNPGNDGNIGICLYNFGDKTVIIGKGEAVAQGIFQKFLVSDNCNTLTDRVGGLGSTTK